MPSGAVTSSEETNYAIKITYKKAIRMNQSESDRSLNIYALGEPKPQDGWLVSDWGAGQTSIMNWSDDNVRVSNEGHIEIILDRAPDGSSKLWNGGEIQNATATTTGTWSWTAQAPVMASGAVFGMFTYKSDWQNDPWTEFDFEFVGDDTTRVELNIHMINAAGEHVTLTQNNAIETVIDLGFDAAEGLHTYEVSVSETGATFYIDGKVVGDFTAADMPGGTWNLAPMNSYVDLWAAPDSMQVWAGKWSDPGRPLVAIIADAEIRPGEYGSTYVAEVDPVPDDAINPVVDLPDDDGDTAPIDMPEDSIVGDSEDNTLTGNAKDNTLYGLGGNDILDGKSGADIAYGMGGDDIYWVDDLNDRTIEKLDEGYDQVNSSVDWTLTDNVEALLLDNNLHIDGTGNALDNTLIGSGGRNVISGLAGDDILDGQGGQDILFAASGSDTLIGGRGTDSMYGGVDNDSDTFVFNSAKDSRTGNGHDVIYDFISGIDKMDFSGFDTDASLAGQNGLIFSGSSAAAYSIWAVDTGADLLVQADVDGNSSVDFEVLVKDVASISANDLLL
jgi:Ca2+-binding RTX toxin-like protein